MDLFFSVLVDQISFVSVAYLIVGVFLGILGGALPGISPSMTISLILPMSLYFETNNALMLLIGAYQGAMYGGSISAILINTPGTASAAATVLDGYIMAKNNQAGKALGMSLTASCTGGLVGSIILILSANALASLSLKFGPPEYFGIMLFTLVLIAGICSDDFWKGLTLIALGLFFGTVGADPIDGTERFTFEISDLYDGVQLLPLFIGIFALSELLTQAGKSAEELNKPAEVLSVDDNHLSLKEYLSQLKNVVISGIYGCFIGILPGLGGSTAAFVAYADAKRRSKHPEKFGTGIIDGVAAPEAANNAVCGGALVPMLTLGIPGDVVTAILMGAFIAHGIKPGPQLFTQNIGEVYKIYIAIILSVVALYCIGKLLLKFFVKLIGVRKSYLLPFIFVLCVLGTYASRGNLFDPLMMVTFGAIGFILRAGSFQLTPVVIAFILGMELESSFRQSLRVSDMDPSIFFTRPFSLFFLVATAIFTAVTVYNRKKKRKTDAA